MSARKHVIVVGAGIIGAAIALSLARAGARVTVLDAGAPGGIATRASWAWLNASWGNPEPYFRLRVRALAEWRALAETVPDLGVLWPGSLYWEVAPDVLRQFADSHAAWGYNVRLVGRDDIVRREPLLAAPPDLAVLAPDEGVVEPLEATLALLAEATRLGASVVGNLPVQSLELRGDRVEGVRTLDGVQAADEVVLAVGVATTPLLARAGLVVPVQIRPSIVVTSAPHAKLLNGLLLAPGAEIRQTAAGKLLACATGETFAPDDATAPSAFFESLRGMFSNGATLALERHWIGHRPVPRDGFPIVGRVGDVAGLYVAVTHSGITLAPAIGRFAAEEILAGQRDALLATYGAARFLDIPAPRGTVRA